METIGFALVLFVVGGMGVTIGIYIASQIKCHIRKNIFNNNFENFEDGEKKRKK